MRSRDELQSEGRDAEAVRHDDLGKKRASFRACTHRIVNPRYQLEIGLQLPSGQSSEEDVPLASAKKVWICIREAWLCGGMIAVVAALI